MARAERILAMDIGAASIKLSEFEIGDDGSMMLLRFAYREYEEELSDVTRMGVIAGLLRQMLAEGGFTAKRALVCLSGQLSLVRFSRLPIVNVDKKRIRQMAEFEATQNIPFEIRDVILDYQLIGFEAGEAVDIMSVVIKNDIVEQFTDAIFSVSCEPILIEVSPAAIYNVGRACGIGDNECSMILNIGGRVSNLVFLDGEKFYSRTIPIAGNSITQQIAKEFGISIPEAEELKRHHGFVSLGGAYAEPESETAAGISRIVRNVMARLHGEISRTINVFCSQQKGNKPVKLYLAGGSSILTYCDTFFSEKLKMPVEYFNPFKCVALSPDIDRIKLQEIGHVFGECIGLGLRYAVQCPVELTLIPANIRRQQQLDRRKPYFLFAAVAIIALLGVVWYGLKQRVAAFTELNATLGEAEAKVKEIINPIEEAQSKTNESKGQIEAMQDLIKQQATIPSILNEIYRLKPDYVWITAITPIMGKVDPIGGEDQNNPDMMDPMGMGMPGGGGMPVGAGMPGGGMPGGGMPGGGGAGMPGGGMPGGMFAGDPMMGPDGMWMDGPMIDNSLIAGFEICGSAIKPDSDEVKFTIPEGFVFPFKVDKELPPGVPAITMKEPAESASEEEKEKYKAEVEAQLSKLNEIMLEAIKKAGNTPELVFETALRNSRIFDSDEKMTGITYDKTSDNVKNYSDFKIQVKLMTEIKAPTFEEQQGGGMDMMMGGGMPPM